MKLAGKKALVTGASRGIGRAVTERFLAGGAEVWGLSTKEPGDLAEWIVRCGGKLHWQIADLGNLDTVEKLIEEMMALAGGFDILVNNAGIIKRIPMI